MILSFDKPKKLNPTEKHNLMYSSDSGIEGTYVPNMSQEDMNRWKAKHIKGADERIEIRKSMCGTQLLIIVYKTEKYISWEKACKTGKQDEYYHNNRQIHISMNGKLQMSGKDYVEMSMAIEEAKLILGV